MDILRAAERTRFLLTANLAIRSMITMLTYSIACLYATLDLYTRPCSI